MQSVKKQKFSGYWKNLRRQRIYFDDIAKALKINHWEDWYRFSKRDVMKHEGGISILSIHGHSLYKALSSIYPEYKWNITKFRAVPSGFWTYQQNQK